MAREAVCTEVGMVHEMFRKAVKSLASGGWCTDAADETNP